MARLGRVLAIVNPTSDNGRAAAGEKFLLDQAESLPEGVQEIVVERTLRPKHAQELAASAVSFDAVIALGGDGVIHETLCGLMQIPADVRPALAVIPFGNGNDAARTLGMKRGDMAAAFDQLLSGKVRPMDVGECNGEHFIETVSFGLDAAIAHGTAERRVRTGRSGTLLFAEEGVVQLVSHRDAHHCRFVLDAQGEAPVAGEGNYILMAFQNGPTYGGGFKVVPSADPLDGKLSMCLFEGPCSLPKAAVLFLSAKEGKHVGLSKRFSFGDLSSAHLEFDREVPAQIDGEKIEGSVFDILIHPGALNVVFAD